MTIQLYSTSDVLDLGFSHYIIFVFSICGIAWGLFKTIRINGIKTTDYAKLIVKEDDKETEKDTLLSKEERQKQTLHIMTKCNAQVKEGAKSFLVKEYTILGFFCLVFAGVLVCAVDMPWSDKNDYGHFPYTAVCFLVGASTSMLAGYLGMMIATTCNVKVTYLCNESIDLGFNTAFDGGQVLGFTLVGLALLVLEVLILCFKNSVMNHNGKDHRTQDQLKHQAQVLFEMISGYGLGGSTVALFGRVGGGIYTKAADVGADLAGKVIENLEEDSPLNPGTIADNVGDNVGDIAGMGADLFGSLAESTCAALVVSTTSWNLISTPGAVYFPLMVTSVGIGASFICVQFVYFFKEIMAKLRWQLYISTILMSVCVIPLIFLLPEQLNIEFAEKTYAATRIEVYACVMLGLWSGLLIGLSTEYYTSQENSPTQALAYACLYSAATNIIQGLALGYLSCIIPICCLAITVLLSFKWAAMYGVALAALGMLGCLPVCLAIDGYGPISDNAGGIAEMAPDLSSEVRDKTDKLDAAGNTTAAIGKGFAIGSACLVALALFGAYITRIAEGAQDKQNFTVNILEPFTFAGILFGAMLPYAFSALTMKAVGQAAMRMIDEIKRQVQVMREHVPDCLNKDADVVKMLALVSEKTNETYPDVQQCVKISTNESLRYMILPGCIVVLSPLLFGWLFGYNFVSGMLTGTITSGIQIAFSASNTGGAWDNCKKYIEAKKLKRDPKVTGKEIDADKLTVVKGDDEHKNAVTGDTVGDPLKDTSGPSINILIKLMAITSLVFGTFIQKYGGLIPKHL